MHKFEPKVCTRKHPRIKLPLRLADQCCKQLIKQYKRVSVEMNNSYNLSPLAWNLVRNYTNEIIAPYTRLCVMKQAVETCTAAEALGILDLFLPGQENAENTTLRSPIDNINLVAANSLQFGYYSFSSMKYEIHADYLLNRLQLGKLCSIFQRLPSLKPKQLAVAFAQNRVVRATSLAPMLLPSLTKLSILTGATDQILGLIGQNCPSLNFLDVSLSSNVTDQGIVALLIRQPGKIRKDREDYSIQRTESYHFEFSTKTNLRDRFYFYEMLVSDYNPCASTLDTIVLTQTKATLTGLKFICSAMNTGFALDLFPIFSKVCRIKEMKEVEGTAVTKDLISSCSKNIAIKFGISCGDVLKIGKREQTTETIFGGCNDVHLVLRHNDMQVSYLFKTTGDQITTLVLHECATLKVYKLGQFFPKLKYYYGKLGLEEDFKLVDKKSYVMRDLQVVNSNMCKRHNVTVFLLRFAPVLANLRVWVEDGVFSNTINFELNDTTLADCLSERQRENWRLEDFVVVNSKLLTIDALKCLIERCPNLKRIGDLNSWKRIKEQDIADFNQRLDGMNSQCVLSVVTPPSTLREQMFHSSDMSFMRIDEIYY